MCLVLVPYAQNPNFVTRPEPLSAIKKQLGLDQQGESVRSRRRASLYGLGGAGYGLSSSFLSLSLSLSYVCVFDSNG
jgi:hypothetical protein